MARNTATGKVIRLLDRKTAIVNLGSDDGVSADSVFHILGAPEKVTDPFRDNEVLGEVAVVKAKLKAQNVFERFTVATTRWTIRTQKNDSSNIIYFGMMSELAAENGSVRVREEDLQPWKAQSEVPVLIGDEVVVEVEVDEMPSEEQREEAEAEVMARAEG